MPESLFEGSDTNEGRELSGRKRAELRQLREERPAKHGTHSGNASHKRLIFLEGRVLFDGLLEVPIDADEFFFEPPYVSFKTRADFLGGARGEAILLRDQHPDELSSAGEDGLKPKSFGFRRGFWFGSDSFGEASEDQSVDLVGFGDTTGGLGEIRKQAGVDQSRLSRRRKALPPEAAVLAKNSPSTPWSAGVLCGA